MAAAEKKNGTAHPGTAKAKRNRVYARKTDIVLEAAERVFLQSGFANTSMDAVAELAGVSKRTVYSNFGNKQDLFAAVIRKRCSDVLPEAPKTPATSAAEIEPELIKLATQFLRSIYSREQVELYQTVVAESRTLPEIGRIMFEGPISRSQEIFASFLRAHTESGALALPEPDLAAAQLIALLKTNLHMRLLLNQPAPINSRRLVASATSSVKLFLYGARSVGGEGAAMPTATAPPSGAKGARRKRHQVA